MTDKAIDPQRLINALDSMSAFSPAALKIIDIANRINAEAAHLVEAVQKDPMLMAKVLKLVNSAYFGMRTPVSSLSRAVILLGFNTIKNIALSVALTSGMKVADSFRWFDNEAFWRHCLACGLASKDLAHAQGVSLREADEYFVAGLLHDIGKVIILKEYAADCAELYDPSYRPDTPKYRLEQERFGMDHASLGGRMATSWKFPPSLAGAIAWHHEPLLAPDEARRLALTVHMANRTVHDRKIGIQADTNLGSIAGEIAAGFPLDDQAVAKAVTGLEEKVDEAKAFLTVER
ncbi:MAG: HDOD domain-containing protein [Nitrospinae bacterium]|nr:HDOD domain-containing protein [Nitrospinota bacterium]